MLSRLLRRVGSDYLAVYGHRVLAVETFTDPARHTGACYQAANFRLPGDTLGFSRSAGSYHFHGNTKRVWWYPLHRDTQRILAAAFPHPMLSVYRGGRCERVRRWPEHRAAGGAVGADRSAWRRSARCASILTIVAAAALARSAGLRAGCDFAADLPRTRCSGGCAQASGDRHVHRASTTIRRTVQGIDADEADSLIGPWLMEQVRAGRLTAGQVPGWTTIALDGKP